MGRRIFAALVVVGFLYVASPLILPVIMGAVLATLFFPWLERLERRKVSTAYASALLTAVIALFFLLPVGLMTFVSIKGVAQQLSALKAQQTGAAAASTLSGEGGWTQAFVSMPKVHSILISITQWLPVQLQDLTDSAQEVIRLAANKLGDLLGGLITRLPGGLLATAVSVVSVYFFLVDGRRMVVFFRRNSVFGAEQTDQLVATLAGTCRSVVLASVISGAAQAFLETVVCVLARVPNPFLIGMLVFLGSFIPVIGSVPVTLGVALQQFLADQEGTALVLLVSAMIVSLIDNLIRPMFLRGSANLHPLLAFVAAFGGLQTLGFTGVFIGPIIAAMFVVTGQILLRGEER